MRDIGAATAIASSVATNPAVHAATRAALELVVSSGIGIASIERGLINGQMIKALSKATFTILLPLFLGTSILKTITKYGLSKSSLAVPFLAAIQSFLLYTFTTRILFPLFLSQEEIDTDEARGAAVCSSFGNSGVVPLIFCDSLFRNAENDNLALSTGFVSMFLVGWSPFFWSWGRSVLLGPSHQSEGKQPSSAQATQSRGEKIIASFQKLVPAPVMGVFIGMFVAIIPVLQGLFVNDEGSAPLGVVFDTAQNFGKAASPLSLLVLVSSLALGAGFGKQHAGQSLSKVSKDVPSIPFWKRWAIVSLSRCIVSPALMLGLLKAVSSVNWIGTSLEQPMLWFVCLLESCMPPAQNQVTMLQVENRMKQANEMATFLFSVYATCMIPLTIVVSIALDKFGLV